MPIALLDSWFIFVSVADLYFSTNQPILGSHPSTALWLSFQTQLLCQGDPPGLIGLALKHVGIDVLVNLNLESEEIEVGDCIKM